MVEGEWVDDPIRVKDEFRVHFANRFQDPGFCYGKINFEFPNRLNADQVSDLESPVSYDEIRDAVWACGENKSPGPDGYTFDFFRKFWDVVGSDLCTAVLWFFEHGSFASGCNSSFITIIPKILDPKVVNDFRPISLIGCIYKTVTKILASRLSMVISSLISDVQTSFLSNRQIPDGPFIINEILSRCKTKKQKTMIFKVDFAKAYDSIRWRSWRSWIRGSLVSSKSSILVNGSPTSEFHSHCGLKQGDPLAPFLFILIMKSLHLSFSRAIDAGLFTGIKLDSSLSISHLFYADDVVFIGEWSNGNLSGILNILKCFSLLSGLSINLNKSQLLGVGVSDNRVFEAALTLGCSVMKYPFKYLGVRVGDNMSLVNAWDDTVTKLRKRLSRWKLKTLSIGGRLTLLKSVLGSSPIYNMSLFKAPKSVINKMEGIRRDFFNGIQEGHRKISWTKWSKVLAAKKFGGLGVSSFFALNRALLAKWFWRYLTNDGSLWCRVISSIHGGHNQIMSAAQPSLWGSIIKEMNSLKVQGVDIVSHFRIRVGNGSKTRFWKDIWIGDSQLQHMFPRLFALESAKDSYVAEKLDTGISASFRRTVRGGAESYQLDLLLNLLEPISLSSLDDRWVCDLNGDGEFRVKDIRLMIDEFFLPKGDAPTRWINCIPIKVNIFAWKMFLDRLPTRSNLARRNVVLSSVLCPICDVYPEDMNHLFFKCSMTRDITRLVCRWWDLGESSFSSYGEWLSFFKSIRLTSKLKIILEGVFYTMWWCLWSFRNRLLFAPTNPRKDSLFDDIVLLSFNWILARGKIKLNWVSWIQHPSLISL
ncbi:RNA-directed DNA polymerase, eukaryota [Tanacetum coccineum]|uniref:RNA-directed DNA polymerase, eukaryota n=1 Tax=Tanacetum coccineum TaxID=301880 RepID=A0ABQ4YFI6_9ASTR